MTIDLLSTLFLLLVFGLASVVIGLFVRYLQGSVRIRVNAVFRGWLLYVGTMGYVGMIASKRPPGVVFLLAPIILFQGIFLSRHPEVRSFAQRIPTALLLGLQACRVLVELSFHELYRLHLVPRMLTFEGANFDILVGLTAPLVAWLFASSRINVTAVRLWSYLGIAMLINIAD